MIWRIDILSVFTYSCSIGRCGPSLVAGVYLIFFASCSKIFILNQKLKDFRTKIDDSKTELLRNELNFIFFSHFIHLLWLFGWFKIRFKIGFIFVNLGCNINCLYSRIG